MKPSKKKDILLAERRGARKMWNALWIYPDNFTEASGLPSQYPNWEVYNNLAGRMERVKQEVLKSLTFKPSTKPPSKLDKLNLKRLTSFYNKIGD